MAGQIISKVAAGGGTHLVAPSAYFVCDTAAATQAKIAKCADTNINAFVPVHGTTIAVRFVNSNTYNGTVTLTLQTNGGTQILAAHNLYRYGTTNVGTNVTNSWNANSIVTLTYDTALNSSGYWIMNNWLNNDSNTDTKVTQTTTTTSANYEVLFSATADDTTRTEAARKSANLLFNPSTGALTFGNGTTGQLIAKTPSRTGAIITVGGGKKTAGNGNGTALRIGAGGVLLLGGGEYADSRYNVGDIDDEAELLYMGADAAVYIETNGNTIADRKTFSFSSAGTFNSPVKITQNGTAVSLVGHTHTANKTVIGTTAVSGTTLDLSSVLVNVSNAASTS